VSYQRKDFGPHDHQRLHVDNDVDGTHRSQSAGLERLENSSEGRYRWRARRNQQESLDFSGEEARMATAMMPAGGMSDLKPGHVAARRRFRLLDAMILIAATGVACGLMLGIERVTQGQVSWSTVSELASGAQGQLEAWKLVVTTVFLVVLLAMPFAAMWTLAIIPLRFTGPRPRFRRLARQPGINAAFSACVALVLAGVEAGVTLWLDGNEFTYFFLLAIPTYPALAVLIAWMTLLVGGRWRAEPSWVDRLGRALGVYWIVEGIFVTSVVFCGGLF
jgi:hypothetical protein